MLVRVLQMDRINGCLFATPCLNSGEEVPIGLFTSGTPFDLHEKLKLPILHEGLVAPVNMLLDAVPILTDAAANAFKSRLNDEIQLIPCTSSEGQLLWIANVLQAIDCIDREFSRAEYYPINYPLRHLAGGVKTAFELCLTSQKVEGHELFRVKGDNLKLVCATSFLDYLSAANVHGLTASAHPRYRVI